MNEDQLRELEDARERAAIKVMDDPLFWYGDHYWKPSKPVTDYAANEPAPTPHKY